MSNKQRKLFLLELVQNYPDAVAIIQSLDDISFMYYGKAYGVTPAIFCICGKDEQLVRVRLEKSNERLYVPALP